MRKLAFLASFAVACSAQPPRFADRAPVVGVHDDAPIAVPRRRAFLEEVYLADVHVRREVVKSLDPRRAPDALDASSVDEVPRSSWYRGAPDPRRPLEGYRRDGPPEPPYTLTGEPPASGTSGALAMVDARGLAYEVLPDVRGRPAMRTGAGAVASRIFHMIGYRTAETYVVPWS